MAMNEELPWTVGLNESSSGLVEPGTSFQCRFTSTETIRLIRGFEPRTATSTFTLLLSSDHSRLLLPSWCFTSTETIRLIGDGKPRTATSTFTPLLSSELLCVYRFSVALRPLLLSSFICFTSTETMRLILGTRSPGRPHLDFHTAAEFCAGENSSPDITVLVTGPSMTGRKKTPS